MNMAETITLIKQLVEGGALQPTQLNALNQMRMDLEDSLDWRDWARLGNKAKAIMGLRKELCTMTNSAIDLPLKEARELVESYMDLIEAGAAVDNANALEDQRRQAFQDMYVQAERQLRETSPEPPEESPSFGYLHDDDPTKYDYCTSYGRYHIPRKQ